MPLPSPKNYFTVNARQNGVTRFVQDGAGLAAATKVVVTHEVAAAGDPKLTFDATATFVSATRLLVSITCTSPDPKPRIAAGNIRVVTTGPGADDSGLVPTIFEGGRLPQPAPGTLPKVRLRYKAGAKKVVFLPVTGLGKGSIGVSVTDIPKGTWKVTAKQQPNRVRMIVECLLAPQVVMAGPGGGSSSISVTLVADDDSVVDLPPMDLEFEDPDDDPDNP